MSSPDVLWRDPHHDGSSWCTEPSNPDPGATVRLRVLVPRGPDGEPGATEVSARVVRDGEPVLLAATPEPGPEGPAGVWWAVDVVVHNPVTPYRFLLTGPPGSAAGGYAWLNGTGVHRREVTDEADFRLVAHPAVPDWVADAVVYQVFPDRFGRSGAADARPVPEWAEPADWDDPVVHEGPSTPLQFFGGDLPGVTEHLDHLVGLGATVLYLTPFFPSRSNHRYDATTFDVVDPALGGDEALVELLDAAHARGLRVVGDLTTNHTGDQHEWFRTAVADPASPEHGFYYFEDEDEGGGAGPGYACWLGVTSLPKLDHASVELRRRFYDGPDSVVARWLRLGLDGWRIDVANMTGRHRDVDLNHEVARTLVRTARETRPDAWVLAEHGHDATRDLQVGDGWHGTMDYAGFTRPVWTWLSAGESLGRTFFGQPARNPSVPGQEVVAALREVHAAMPWRAQAASTLHLDSHDIARFRTAVGGGGSGGISPAGRDRHLVGLAAQFSLPGVPSVFAGDEIGLTGRDGEHARTPFPWDRPHCWDEETLTAYRAWIALRAAHPALRRGGLRWISSGPDWFTFVRGHREEAVLVHVARGSHEPLALPLSVLGATGADDVVAVSPAPGQVSGSVPHDAPDSFVLRAGGPGSGVWRLPVS
ncbi:glycoside hydrolase family 13 protein [Kineococcus gynurae]|uniref:Glycoside hydrolase family 13 protein n=1 Tax=Kineococcus gynurae TaxID=452979 RepID=A0ABV5LP86_9ACTN